MAHNLSLQCGGTTLSIGSSTNYVTTFYIPKEPDIDLGSILTMVQAGTDGDLTVTETIEILVKATTKTLLQTAINDIQYLAVQARNSVLYKLGDPLYLHLLVDDNAVAYRSQILEARWELKDEALTTWAGIKAEGRLHITRRYYWERITEIELELAAVGALTPSTGGKAIINDLSGSLGNYVTIAAGHVAGILPAPPRIELLNNTGATKTYSNIYIGNEVRHDGGATYFAGVFQGENKQASGSGSVVTPATGASGNGYLDLDLTGFGSSRWLYTAAQIQAAQGQTYRLFTRLMAYTIVADNVVHVQPMLVEETGSFDLNPFSGIERSLAVNGSDELVDVGSLGFGSFTDAGKLAVMMRFRSQATIEVDIDYLHPFPANNFRHLVYTGAGLFANEVIVDDGPNATAYVRTAISENLPTIAAKYKPIMIWPRLAQRIFILTDQSGGGFAAPITNGFNIRVFYRPRRLSV